MFTEYALYITLMASDGASAQKLQLWQTATEPNAELTYREVINFANLLESR